VTRKRVVTGPGLAWAASLVGAWLAAAACRTLQTGAAAAAPEASVDRTVGDPLAGVEAPRVRVGIRVEAADAAASARSGLAVHGRLPGETATLLRHVATATFVPVAGSARLRLRETGDELLLATVVPAAPGERLRLGESEYRGAFEVRPAPGEALTVVNVANLEDYLRGVVANELSPDAFPHIEAQKAQAVAARSWVLAHLGQYASKGYDVCATPACQVYRGTSSEHPLTDRAVAETRQVVATWRGRPINAYYTSTCGGHTEDGAAIFKDRAPYLRGVACAVEAHPGGEAQREGKDRWEVRLTPAQVAKAVSRYGFVGEVRDIVPTRLGVSGRVVELQVVGSEQSLDLRGLRVRWGLGLRESLFELSRETGPGGEVERFVIHGRGWGHGVGLCQVGAFGMARSGASYEGILRHYYSGIRLDRL
jgi:stage II sporulation protein D